MFLKVHKLIRNVTAWTNKSLGFVYMLKSSKEFLGVLLATWGDGSDANGR